MFGIDLYQNKFIVYMKFKFNGVLSFTPYHGQSDLFFFFSLLYVTFFFFFYYEISVHIPFTFGGANVERHMPAKGRLVVLLCF